MSVPQRFIRVQSPQTAPASRFAPTAPASPHGPGQSVTNSGSERQPSKDNVATGVCASARRSASAQPASIGARRLSRNNAAVASARSSVVGQPKAKVNSPSAAPRQRARSAMPERASKPRVVGRSPSPGPAFEPPPRKSATGASQERVCENAKEGPKTTERKRHRGVKVEASYRIGSAKVPFFVSSGSVLDFQGDAIVADTREPCLGVLGVDKKISDAAGPRHRAARMALPVCGTTEGGHSSARDVRCPMGEARIVDGGDLKARFVILAVGPNYKGSEVDRCDEILVQAYQQAFDCARQNAVTTIAFTLLCGGVFRGSQTARHVMERALEGIQAGVYEGLEEVHIIAFKSHEVQEMRALCKEAFAPVFSNPPSDVYPHEQQTTAHRHAVRHAFTKRAWAKQKRNTSRLACPVFEAL